ncbi:SDR family NAD(P)-dependent oxidoreductase [Emcibacter nanhaiensis]|uniref:Glucose 1-dehydrogenase n=1 Tax=Emcibacter nanhaiensis TaxID=1505037 RepID=A0A501PF27_9PROT|nr:glucose 1-dehydrogenase [Emcibacter nanhaiensis]TPD59049.1 glucose 1-dehydrogenase [Emcibacter nanhaiensis]
MKDFTGKTALVTGSTTGIGLAMAEALAAEGAHVLINSEDAALCDEVAGRLNADGHRATSLLFDLSDSRGLPDFAKKALAVDGKIDCLFCNAGITGSKRRGEEGYEDEVEKVFAINLHHSRILCDHIVPHMAENGGGSVVLTSSLSGLRGNKSIGVYSLTKAAVAQLARDLAVGFGPDNVRVNSISPGLIATGWEKNILSNPEAAERRMRMTPLRRVGQPQEIANAALFLASDKASFITGHNLVVDGGTVITDGN